MKPLLEVEDVSVAIGDLLALHDVTFALDKGECLGIVGETGSGKTLTCRVLTGMLGRIHARVIAGRVTFDGTELTTISENDWRAIRGRRIGFVPQNSLSSLDPVMRIGRQLQETIAALDPTADAWARARELLELVQMRNPASVQRSYPHELSGGMQQRVMIALGIAGGAPLLVADEPTTALDVTVQREILDLLDRFRRELGMALVLVTHDLAVIRSRADRVAVMYSGAVVERGRVTDIFRAPAHPYTRALLNARPLEAAPGVRLTSIPGSPPALDHQPPGCPFAPRCELAEPACDERFPLPQEVSSGHVTRCRRWEEMH